MTICQVQDLFVSYNIVTLNFPIFQSSLTFFHLRKTLHKVNIVYFDPCNNVCHSLHYICMHIYLHVYLYIYTHTYMYIHMYIVLYMNIWHKIYHKEPLTYFYLFVLGPHTEIHRVQSCSVVRNHTYWCLEDHMSSQGSNPGWSCTRQASYLLINLYWP